MKKILPIILLGIAAICLAVAGWKAWTYQRAYPHTAPSSTVTIKEPSVPGDASIICFSLLKDFSEESIMQSKVREVIADGDFSSDDCQTLINYSDQVKAAEEARRKNQYFLDAKDNVK